MARRNLRHLEDFLRSSGLSFRTTARSFVFTCPMCHRAGTLYMFRDSGHFACQACREETDFQGAPEFALRELTGRSIRELREALYGVGEAPNVAPLDLRFEAFLDDDEQSPAAEQSDLPDLVWPLSVQPLTRACCKPGVDYLATRGVSVALALSYDVRYDVERRAIAFPAWVDGRLVGWQTRVIDPLVVEHEGQVFERVKANSTKGFPRDRIVMFADRLRNAPHAVVAEGGISAMKADLVGGNVATAGKAVAVKQVQLLLRSGIRKFYLALDPDAVAEIEGLRQKFDAPDVELREVQIPAPYDDLGAIMDLEEARDVVLAAPLVRPGVMRGWFKAAPLVNGARRC